MRPKEGRENVTMLGVVERTRRGGGGGAHHKVYEIKDTTGLSLAESRRMDEADHASHKKWHSVFCLVHEHFAEYILSTIYVRGVGWWWRWLSGGGG